MTTALNTATAEAARHGALYATTVADPAATVAEARAQLANVRAALEADDANVSTLEVVDVFLHSIIRTLGGEGGGTPAQDVEPLYALTETDLTDLRFEAMRQGIEFARNEAVTS